MSGKKRLALLLRISAICFFINALCYLVMLPAVRTLYWTRAWVILLGVIFWASLLIGYGTILWAIVLYCKHRRTHQAAKRRLPGLLRFGSNPLALIFDILLGISVILLIITLLTKWKESYFSYVVLCLLSLSLHLHALLNGNIYRTVHARKTHKANETQNSAGQHGPTSEKQRRERFTEPTNKQKHKSNRKRRAGYHGKIEG